MRQNTFTLVLRANLLELLVNVFDNVVGHALDGQVRDQSDGEFACVT
jgi:hypothetical protein